MAKVKSQQQSGKKQLYVTIGLIVLIVGLLGGLFLIQQRLDIRDRAAGPVCQLYTAECSWTPVEGVTGYNVKIVDDNKGEVPIFERGASFVKFAGTPGSSYTCTVTAQVPEGCDPISGSGGGSCAATQGEPTVTVTIPSDTPTPTPDDTLISQSPSPSATLPPDVTPSATPTLPPGVSPTPTSVPVGGIQPTSTPQSQTSPTPTDIIVTSQKNTPTPTTVTSLPESGIIEPSIMILLIGIAAIAIPLFL